jgi:MscS family membrane protein
MLEVLSFLAAGVWRDIIVAPFVFLVFILAGIVFTKYILKAVLKVSQKAELDKKILLALDPPLRVLFIVLGLYFSLKFLPLNASLDALIIKLFRTSIIVLLTWGFYNLTGTYLFAAVGRRLDLEIDEILIPFLSKILRVIIIVLAMSIIAEEWGYNVSGFVAGLGLGGLAIALAAKDALGNIFGGIVIIMDKPFSMGEWISSPSVEGVVEDISFRSTKVRTFANALVTVPNSTLANEPITNWAKMEKRRISFNLEINNDTPAEKLKNCLEKIRVMLENHPAVHKDTIFAVFDQFNEGRLAIFFYFFTITTNWGEFLKIKEEINFNIMAILEEEGVSLAFPGRNIYLPNDYKITKNEP